MPKGAVKIVAVGDSITYGGGSSDKETKAWPPQLFQILGGNSSTYEVFNYGVSSTTMMKTGDHPYWDEPEYQLTLESSADIILMMLGTNDAKTFQWDQNEYVKDYREMATSFLVMESAPTVYIMVPPPLYHDGDNGINQTVINHDLPVILPMDVVAPLQDTWGVERVPVEINIFEALGGADLLRYEAFCDFQDCDQTHPNDAGYNALALAVFKALVGGPPLPPQAN